ncbi:MAG: porin [Rhodobiaceae bacterium]|nr:porin [Rhodobiaceae bacterium]
MNKFKSLLLGTAAAAIAATGAQAADAPMGREPVYRCDITGFIELPGTNICFKVGGFARLIVWGANEDAGTVEPVEGDALGGDDFGMYAQGRLNFDARRSTDHGTVRAFVEVQATDNNSNTGGALQLRHAFAQLGNWVFGKTSSTFLHGASSANGTDPTITGHTIRINQIRYTHSIGNGLTVAVAIEDQAYENTRTTTSISTTAVNTTNVGFTPGNGGSGENNLPNFVANIHYSNGGWDTQLSGVLHQNEFGDGTDELGYGILLGIAGELTDQLNLIAKIGYFHANPSYAFDFFSGGTNTGDDYDQFGIVGGVAYEVSDEVTFQLAGFWGTADNNNNTVGAIPAPATVSGTGTNAVTAVDHDLWGASALISWRPVGGFEFLGELMYRNTDPAVGADTDEVIGVFSAAASF